MMAANTFLVTEDSLERLFAAYFPYRTTNALNAVFRYGQTAEIVPIDSSALNPTTFGITHSPEELISLQAMMMSSVTSSIHYLKSTSNDQITDLGGLILPVFSSNRSIFFITQVIDGSIAISHDLSLAQHIDQDIFVKCVTVTNILTRCAEELIASSLGKTQRTWADWHDDFSSSLGTYFLSNASNGKGHIALELGHSLFKDGMLVQIAVRKAIAFAEAAAPSQIEEAVDKSAHFRAEAESRQLAFAQQRQEWLARKNDG